MSHLDSDRLALLALGEPAASLADCSHLRSCAECSSEVSELVRTVRVARTTSAEPTLEAPPERVWRAVVEELGLNLSSTDTVPGTDAGSAAPEAPATGLDEVPPPPARPVAAATTSPRRRGSSRGWWALAAAIALVAGVGLGSLVLSIRATPQVIAAAALDAFPEHPGATGSADVTVARDGSREISVSVQGGVVPDTLREVWLIRNDAGALISLGLLEGDQGTFAVPDGIDLAEYSLVDVSVEKIDGDPAHSGDSIVRGKLAGV